MSEILNHLKRHWNGTLLGHDLLNLIFIISRHIKTSIRHLYHRTKSSSTVSILRSIRILFLRCQSSSIFNILKGMRRKPSLAPMIIKGSSTVYKLLLTEKRGTCFIDNRVMGLDGSSSGKSPAATAVALIFHFAYFTFTGPVYGFWEIWFGGLEFAIGGTTVLGLL